MALLLMAGLLIAASAANTGGTAVAAFLPAAIPIGKPALKAS
jgi:hypothetical protein